MGNGALPNGPSYRAHPRLYRLGHSGMPAQCRLLRAKRTTQRRSIQQPLKNTAQQVYENLVECSRLRPRLPGMAHFVAPSGGFEITDFQFFRPGWALTGAASGRPPRPANSVLAFRCSMSAFDAVDGLLHLHVSARVADGVTRFGGGEHASGHDSRSRHRKVGFPGSWHRRAWR
jgi:hypothetical protein